MTPSHIRRDSRIAADQAIFAGRSLVVGPQPYRPARIQPVVESAVTLTWAIFASASAIVVEYL